jgi:hypothetical protein
MSEKMSAENEQSDNSLSPFLEVEQTKGNTLRAWKAGHSSGYARGKAEERKRIWEAVTKIEYGAWADNPADTIKQIIFGGGEHED